LKLNKRDNILTTNATKNIIVMIYLIFVQCVKHRLQIRTLGIGLCFDDKLVKSMQKNDFFVVRS